MYLPVEPGRLIEGPVNRGPENRGCTVLDLIGFFIANQSSLQQKITMQERHFIGLPIFFFGLAVVPLVFSF